MGTALNEEIAELPKNVRFAFAPLVKRAMGFAFGVTFALTLAFMTVWHWVYATRPEDRQHLHLIQYNFFKGYDPETGLGLLIGILWALWTGFVFGWFMAALRNFFVAVWIIVIRTKANLRANRDFLDHI